MKSVLNEAWVLAKINEGGVEKSPNPNENIDTFYKHFDNGYLGYSEVQDGKPLLNMYIHDLPNGDVFSRSVEYNTGSNNPEDFFQINLNQELSNNYNVITRENCNRILDCEYDKNGNTVREREYKLATDTYFDEDKKQGERYDANGDFSYGWKGSTEYLSVKDYLSKNKSLLDKYSKRK